MCHVLPVCLFMDAWSFQTHLWEWYHRTANSTRVGGRQATSVQFLLLPHVCHRIDILCQHKVRLLGQNKSSWEYNLKLSRGYSSTKKFMGWFYASVNKKSQWEFSLRWGYKPHIIKLWLCSPSCFVNLPEQNQIITNSVDLWPCAAPPPFPSL